MARYSTIVKVKREEMRLTQYELAREAGVSASTLSKFESGDEVSEVVVKAIRYSIRKLEDAMPEQRRLWDERKKFRNEHQHRWAFLTPYIDGGLNEVKIQKDLDREADAKYDYIVDTTTRLVGEIVDATNLKIGAKGDLNGFIVGKDGKAKVETVGAGGYAIQRFHYRTLIHKMK